MARAAAQATGIPGYRAVAAADVDGIGGPGDGEGIATSEWAVHGDLHVAVQPRLRRQAVLDGGPGSALLR